MYREQTECINKSGTYRILNELSMIENHRIPQDKTGEKKPRGWYKSLLRNIKFLKTTLNGREVCGRHTTVHTLPRYLDIISSKLTGALVICKEKLPRGIRNCVFSHGAMLSMPDKDSDLGPNQVLSCFHFLGPENIQRGGRCMRPCTRSRGCLRSSACLDLQPASQPHLGWY